MISNKDSGWDIANDEDHTFSYKNGEYECSIYLKNVVSNKTPKSLSFEPKNYSVQLEARLTNKTAGFYGIIFDKIEKDYLVFLVNPNNQSFALDERLNGKWNWIVKWELSDQIKKGKEKNLLKIEKYQENVRLYINDQLVKETKVKMRNSNVTAGVCVNNKEDTTVVRFDNFIIRKVSESQAVASNPVVTTNPVTEPALKPTPPGEFVFSEDFSNSLSGWADGKYPGYYHIYKDGEFEIGASEPNKLAFGIIKKLIIPSTFYSVQTEAYVLKGSHGIYGLYFNAVDPKKCYMFAVNFGTKCFQLMERVERNWVPIINWTEFKDLQTGNKKNLLKVEQYGDYVKLYINEVLVGESKIQTFGNTVGAGLYFENQDKPVSVRFDNFQVKELPKQTITVKEEAKPRYILVEGRDNGMVERKAVETIDKAIIFMEKLWEVKLARPVQIYMYSSAGAFQNGLVKYADVSPKDARLWSDSTVAFASDYNILVNKAFLIRIKEKDQIIAHELIHIFEHDQAILGRSPRAYRCIKEGYSYMVSKLCTEEWEKYKKDAYALVLFAVGEAGVKTPRLFELNAMRDYEDTMRGYGIDNFKQYMCVATDYLLEIGGGHKAFTTYFAGGPKDKKPDEDPFEASFGMTPKEFQEKLDNHLLELAKQKK